MSRQLNQLILNVLKSHTPMRDLRSQLDTFGRRELSRASKLRLARIPSETNAFAVTPPKVLPKVSDVMETDPKCRKVTRLVEDPTSVADRISESQTVDSLSEAHTALVKVQGPFSDRQLRSIAEGLAYLKQLGLSSVVVLDHDGWQSVSHFNREGVRIDEDTMELHPWLGKRLAHQRDASVRLGSMETGQRNNMVKQLWRVSGVLSAAGMDPRPYANAIMRIVPENEMPKPSLDLTCGADSLAKRTPLASDDAMDGVYRSLALGQTPIVIPIAMYDDPGADQITQNTNVGAEALRYVCVDANDIMVALAREMAHTKRICTASAPVDEHKRGKVEETQSINLSPLRLMVINREGGLPSHARGGNPHLMINLQSEFNSIRSSFIWSKSHPTALSNMEMIRDCLSYMSSASSGVMVTHRSPRSLIANLITNKAAHSPSLPYRLLANRSDLRHTPTIIRKGLPVRVISDVNQVDHDKLLLLLEASFKRKLNHELYFARLKERLDFVIVTGDYDGLAIVTKEYAPGDDPATDEPIAYLDKFAVLPKLRGSGAVDFLWSALRDEVHGLGLLDALNNNGGRGGYGVGRDLVWKSRIANPVNRWYFERSNGFIRLPPCFGKGPSDPVGDASEWVMFWCDAEQRLAHLAGETLMSPGAMEELLELASASLNFPPPSKTTLPIVAPEEDGRLERWTACLAKIPSAWA
ncbi:amino-acid N-acetyltransferase [Malassezia vespertilionis]|uniref:Amino-acid acetyltransferase, mitochondrial n=1 Tax=Malassezia vespertilionis TaxID=2020962 RepID=A0A2N1JG03_9BASI|nr:amino-acid N-acetyltransferase [Malassezia vespertilionis]PKI85481.1 Arg2p [Malassezia vespertilionis]WFD04793.1 amino-acid N-acetyltransferase [Malassezia vespertilionis]